MNLATLAYRVELFPTELQRRWLARQLLARRRVWNYLLTRMQQRLAAGEALEKNLLNRQLTQLKKTLKYSWLYGVPTQCTHSAAQDLEKTYFAAQKLRAAGAPRYKLRSVKDSFQTSWSKFSRTFRSVKLARCPGGYIRIARHDAFHGKLNHDHARVVKDHGKWFLTFTASVPLEKLQARRQAQISAVVTRNEVVGIDLGLDHFVIGKTDTSAFKIDNPRFFRKAEDALATLQRKRAGKKRYSRRYKRLSKKIAKLHRHTKNQRKQFHHETANRILASAKVVVAEALNVRGMVRNRRLSKSISDAGWSQFRGILKYKAPWYQSEYEETDQYFASSKCCSMPGCAFKAGKLPLKVRGWTCPKCGTVHDRDINAAANIRNTRVDDPRNARVVKKKAPRTIGSWKKHHATRAADTTLEDVPVSVPEMACFGKMLEAGQSPAKADPAAQRIGSAEPKKFDPVSESGRALLQ